VSGATSALYAEKIVDGKTRGANFHGKFMVRKFLQLRQLAEKIRDEEIAAEENSRPENSRRDFLRRVEHVDYFCAVAQRPPLLPW